MRLKLILFFLGFFGILAKSYSQENQQLDTARLSLDEAKKYAQEYNRSIRASKIDVDLANKKVWETTAIGLPQINLSANYQHQFEVPEFSFPMAGLSPSQLTQIEGLQQSEIAPGIWNYYMEGEKIPMGVADNTTFNLTVSQLIFSGEYLVGLQASRVYKSLSEQNLFVSELKTAENIAGSYYVVLILDENISILKESRDLVAKTLSEISKMSEQGYTEQTDVDQMKINLSTLETLLHGFEGQRLIAIKVLKLQMGMDIHQPLVLTSEIEGIIDADNKEYLKNPEFVLDNSPSYKLLDISENLMELNLKREKSKYLPTIAGFYQHQQQMNEPAFNFMPKDIIGITASIPIASSGQRISRIKQAQLDLEKTRLNKEQAGQGLIIEFETALNTYQIAYKNYLTNKESMELSVKIYQKNNVKYKEGLISSLDLTQSQDQFLTAQRNYYQSVVNYLNAKVALDRILTINK